MAAITDNPVVNTVVGSSTAASALVQAEKPKVEAIPPIGKANATAEQAADSAKVIDLPARGSAANAASGQDQATQLSESDLAEAVSKINEHMQVIRRKLEFSLDEDLGRMVVTVTDAETDQVVRQIPSEKALAVAKRLEELKGLLLEVKA